MKRLIQPGFPDFRPAGKPGTTAFSGLRYQKPSVFHSFFHTCGKLFPLLLCLGHGFGGGDSSIRLAALERPSKDRPESVAYVDSLFPCPIAFGFLRGFLGHSDEAYFSTQRPSPSSHAWVYRADAHEKWPAGTQTSSGQRAQAPDGLHPLAEKLIGASWRLHVTAVQLDGSPEGPAGISGRSGAWAPGGDEIRDRAGDCQQPSMRSVGPYRFPQVWKRRGA